MNFALPTASRIRRATLGLAMLGGACVSPAHGFTVAIDSGTRSLFLQVGAGTMTGGNFNNRGTPGNNTTVNSVSVTVPAAQVGSGTALPMATDSTVFSSPWDGFAFCTSPATTGQVYVGGFYRVPGGSTAGAATLTVTTPLNLTSTSGDTIPFNRIAWTSTGNSDNTPTIASAAFTGGAQTLLSVTRNTWFETCLAFRYLNSAVVPGGTFSGTATYTLTAP